MIYDIFDGIFKSSAIQVTGLRRLAFAFGTRTTGRKSVWTNLDIVAVHLVDINAVFPKPVLRTHRTHPHCFVLSQFPAHL